MAKILEKNGVETLAGRFKSILRDRVHRDGVYSMLDWLENETDFSPLRPLRDTTLPFTVGCSYTA